MNATFTLGKHIITVKALYMKNLYSEVICSGLDAVNKWGNESALTYFVAWVHKNWGIHDIKILNGPPTIADHKSLLKDFDHQMICAAELESRSKLIDKSAYRSCAYIIWFQDGRNGICLEKTLQNEKWEDIAVDRDVD